MHPEFKKLFSALAAFIFVALFAQIDIDLPGEIPVSGQSFAVLLSAFLLGRKWGTIAMTIYVLAGISGLPVFAGGAAGMEVLRSGSGGFLIGFIFAGFITGWLSEQGWGTSFWKSLLTMTIGTIVILLTGIGKLTYDYSLKQALEWGFYPFITGALIKIVFGAVLAFLLKSSFDSFVGNPTKTGLNS